MLYLATASSPATREAMRAGRLGMLTTPSERRSPELAQMWAADNGCFGKGYPGDEGWLAWLAKLAPYAERCCFATAPDVVADARATLARSEPHLEAVRALGYPVALVAQDGLEELGVPWDDIDALFIGGSTEWKLGPAAADLANQARSHLKWVHMGRVNSWRRFAYADAIGCDSVDGTYVAFGPDKNLPHVVGWQAQHSLF